MAMYSRWQRKNIQNALLSRRVILLNGPRQCGKTTLAKQFIDHDVTYRTLDHLAMRQLAHNDPHGFIKQPHNMQIIDEIQRAPDLLI